jgi:hypothetical protein
MTPGNPPADRFWMILVIGIVVGGASLMAGAAVVFLMMVTHF